RKKERGREEKEGKKKERVKERNGGGGKRRKKREKGKERKGEGGRKRGRGRKKERKGGEREGRKKERKKLKRKTRWTTRMDGNEREAIQSQRGVTPQAPPLACFYDGCSVARCGFFFFFSFLQHITPPRAPFCYFLGLREASWRSKQLIVGTADCREEKKKEKKYWFSRTGSCFFTTGSAEQTPLMSSNGWKLIKERINLELRRNFLTGRTINQWNELPPEVVSAPTLEVLKKRLDSHVSEKTFKVPPNPVVLFLKPRILSLSLSGSCSSFCFPRLFSQPIKPDLTCLGRPYTVSGKWQSNLFLKRERERDEVGERGRGRERDGWVDPMIKDTELVTPCEGLSSYPPSSWKACKGDVLCASVYSHAGHMTTEIISGQCFHASGGTRTHCLLNSQSPGNWPKITQPAFMPKAGLELTLAFMTKAGLELTNSPSPGHWPVTQLAIMPKPGALTTAPNWVKHQTSPQVNSTNNESMFERRSLQEGCCYKESVMTQKGVAQRQHSYLLGWRKTLPGTAFDCRKFSPKHEQHKL
ncbi:Octapeptide-repeat protein T2, partial [Ophiophagus hannah]